MEKEKYDINKFLLIKKVYTKALSDRKNDQTNSAFAMFAEALENNEFSSQQELSTFIGCNKAHTSRTLIKMQIKGLIKLSYKTISLTEKGKKFAENVRKKKLDLREKLFENVLPQDEEIFFKVVNQILINAKDLTDKQGE